MNMKQTHELLDAKDKEIERLRGAISSLAGFIMNGRIDMATRTKAKADVALLAAEKFARAALETNHQ
jgi:hypothetical protein